MIVGYANGETRVWAWDQASFDPPRPGPRADGPIQASSSTRPARCCV